MDSDRVYTGIRPYQPPRPSNQSEDEQKRLKEVFDQLPLLKETIKHLDKRLAHTDSNKRTIALKAKYSLDSEQAMAVQDVLNDLLTAERNWMTNRVKGAQRIQERKAHEAKNS
jgi:hypothetical protein